MERNNYKFLLIVLKLSTQRQNRLVHVMDWKRTPQKCTKMKDKPAKRAKLLFSLFNMQICDVPVCVVIVVPLALKKKITKVSQQKTRILKKRIKQNQFQCTHFAHHLQSRVEGKKNTKLTRNHHSQSDKHVPF